MMLQIIAKPSALYDEAAMQTPKNKPRRQSLPAGFVIFLSDIRPDSRYGLSPIVQFRLWAEVRVFTPGLGSASGEARSAFRWSLFHNFMDLLFEFRLPGRKNGVSRDIPGASKSGLHRIYRDRIIALWALQEVTAAVAILSLGSKSVRLKGRRVNPKPSRKYFVKLAPGSPDSRRKRQFAPGCRVV
jgi:hypothetical protein